MKINICVDKLNGHDTSGKLGKINYNIGDEISEGDILFTIESGKGSLKVKSTITGTILEVMAKVGDVVKKGDIILIVDGVASEKSEVSSDRKSKSSQYSFGISKPKKEELKVDVAIIGGGPGGYIAAIRCAQLGKRVVLIEEDRMGGTCLNYGCIPTKALAHSTKVLKHIKTAKNYGFNIPSYEIDMPRVIERKGEVVDALVGGIEHLMEANDIRVIQGTGVIQGAFEITVNTKKISALIQYDHLILATGSEVSYINIEGHNLPKVLTSKDALELQTIPKSLTIIGGGVIGMEFAFIYNALGTEVHVIEYLPEILNLLDQDVIDVVKNSALEKGIRLYTGACASGIYETENDMMMTAYQMGEKSHFIATEKVMMAVGRKARIEGIDLDLLGVDLNERKNGIKVDAFMRTSASHVYAIGDVTNIVQLAHVASHQGLVAAENIAGVPTQMHYDQIPSAIFTSPEIGHVGLTEKDADAQGRMIKVTHFPFMANGKSIAMNETEGFVKIISCPEEGIVLGATIVGTGGTDMIATLGNLIHSQTKIDDAVKVIYAHPTAAESIHEALLGALDKGLHNA